MRAEWPISRYSRPAFRFVTLPLHEHDFDRSVLNREIIMSRFGLGLRCRQLRSLALIIGSCRQRRKARCRRPIAAETPATASRADQRGRDRRHRLAHPPRPAEPGRADRVRRPGRHRQDRPQLDQRRAPAPAQLGRRAQQQVQQFGQSRQSARRRRRRRRRGRNRPSLSRLAPRARARRRPALRQRRLGQRAFPARPTSTPSPKA